MKSKIILSAIILSLTLSLSSCGDNAVDVGKNAIVSLPNGELIEGKIESLTRWSSTLTEITIDGVTYNVHPLCLAIIDTEDSK